MESKYYKEYNKICLLVAKTIYSYNSDLDFEDIHQECWLELLRNLNAHYPTPYLYKILYNNVSKTILCMKHGPKTNFKIIHQSKEVKKLLNLGYTKSEIIKKMRISESTYNLIFSILHPNISLKENMSSYERNLDKNLIFEEISEFILEYELNILFLHICGKSNSEIGSRYDRSDEWARLKIIEIIEKIRDHYSE